MEEVKKSQIGKLFLGKESVFESHQRYTQALMTAGLALLGVFLYCFYLLFDYSLGIYTLFPVYIFNIFALSILFIVHRLGRYELAKFAILFITLISLYLFGSTYNSATFSSIYYFPLILFAFTVYGYEGRYKILFLFGLSLLLIYLEMAHDFPLFPRVSLDEKTAGIVININFSASLIITMVVGFYFVRTNYLSEWYLIHRQQQLNEITEQLKESEYRYELAMKGTNAGLWDWDIVNDKTYHGPKWYEMLGYSHDNYKNQNIKDFFEITHPDDIENVKMALKDQLEKDIPYATELRIRSGNGSYEWFRDSGIVIRDRQGQPIRMVGSIINISERKKAEESLKKQNELLEKANSELDRFVYITSHDLKAPLLSIQGLINLAEISDDPSEVTMCLNLMKERIKGLENFISDIIDYSRNARSGLVEDEINLKNITEEIVKDLMYVEEANDINIKVDISDKVKFVSDDKRLKVILKNLIFNAIKYHNHAQKKPTITISGKVENGRIIISIKDNGSGIPSDLHEKIFEMFYRASEKSSGSGLGLYIVKEMISKLKGNIKLISEPGIGSEFIFDLPS